MLTLISPVFILIPIPRSYQYRPVSDMLIASVNVGRTIKTYRHVKFCLRDQISSVQIVQTLGEVGAATKIESKTETVTMTLLDGHSWVYNPLCLRIQKKGDCTKFKSLDLVRNFFLLEKIKFAGLSISLAKARDIYQELRTLFELLEVAVKTRKL